MFSLAIVIGLLGAAPQAAELSALRKPYVVGMLGDCDGDGASDYAVAGRVGGAAAVDRFWIGRDTLRVLSSRDDRCLASFELQAECQRAFLPGLSLIGDVDGDGRRDIIVDSPWDTPAGTILSTADGRRIGGLAEGAEFAGCIGDVDGDGLEDLLASRDNGAGARLPREIVTARDVIPIWPGSIDHGFHWVGADLDGDGVRELVRDAWGIRRQVWVFDARRQQILALWSQATCGWLPGFDFEDVASVELDGDSRNEQIVLLLRAGDENEELGCALLSGATLRASASRALHVGALDRGHAGALEFRVACVGDLDGDGARDVVLAMPSQSIYAPSAVIALSGCDLHELWRRDDLFGEEGMWNDRDFGPGQRLSRAADLVPDRDGDGVPDVLCSDLDSGLFVLSGRTGALVKRFDP